MGSYHAISFGHSATPPQAMALVAYGHTVIGLGKREAATIVKRCA